jgi:hypothetical protein
MGAEAEIGILGGLPQKSSRDVFQIETEDEYK